MTLIPMCCLMAVVYGLLCGAVYTCVTPLRGRRWRRLLVSSFCFTVLGSIIATLFYLVFR